MKKYKIDIIIVIFFISLAFVSWILFGVVNKEEGSYVEVIVNKKTIKILPLDTDCEYKIPVDEHINVIKIKNRKAFILKADCPDQLCVNQGMISKNGQSVICLPNKVIIKIVSENENDIDAIAN